MSDKLTDKQERFCNEYVVDFNGTQAVIRAGYKEQSAAEIASENLRKPQIKARIKELSKEYISQLEGRKLRIIKELEGIAFGDGNIKTDNEGNVTGKDVRDKLKALELLGKTIAMFTDKMDIKGDISNSITKTNINYSELTEDEKNQLIREKLGN